MSDKDTEIPEAAKCTDDLDCVLLTTPPSYRAQLVKVTADEAGLRWKPYLVDIHRNLD